MKAKLVVLLLGCGASLAFAGIDDYKTENGISGPSAPRRLTAQEQRQRDVNDFSLDGRLDRQREEEQLQLQAQRYAAAERELNRKIRMEQLALVQELGRQQKAIQAKLDALGPDASAEEKLQLLTAFQQVTTQKQSLLAEMSQPAPTPDPAIAEAEQRKFFKEMLLEQKKINFKLSEIQDGVR